MEQIIRLKKEEKKFEKDDGRFQLTSQENNTKERTQKSTQKWHEECFWVYVALFTFALTKANAQEEIFLCVFLLVPPHENFKWGIFWGKIFCQSIGATGLLNLTHNVP